MNIIQTQIITSLYDMQMFVDCYFLIDSVAIWIVRKVCVGVAITIARSSKIWRSRRPVDHGQSDVRGTKQGDSRDNTAWLGPRAGKQ